MEWKIIFTGAKSASEYLFCINSEATPTLKEENTGRWSLLNIASEQPKNHKGTVQSTLVISTSVISNNRLSRRKNLDLVITQKSKIRL